MYKHVRRNKNKLEFVIIIMWVETDVFKNSKYGNSTNSKKFSVFKLLPYLEFLNTSVFISTF